MEFLVSINFSFEPRLRQVDIALVLRASSFAGLLDIFKSKQKPQNRGLLPSFYLLAICREETWGTEFMAGACNILRCESYPSQLDFSPAWKFSLSISFCGMFLLLILLTFEFVGYPSQAINYQTSFPVVTFCL